MKKYIRPFWLWVRGLPFAGTLLLFASTLFLIAGGMYVCCIYSKCIWIGICITIENGSNYNIQMALGCFVAGFALLNMKFVIDRINRTDIQIEESQTANFLNVLNQGVSMLYSDSINKQLGGIVHLHNLARANKDNEERIEEVLKVFCSFISVVPSERHIITIERKNGAATITEKWREIPQKMPENIELISAVKQVIFDKIVSGVNKECSIYPSKKIDLSGADLPGWDKLYKADLCGANLSGAHLQRANMQFANLKEVVLVRADLRGADLRNVKGTPIWWSRKEWSFRVRLNYAIMDFDSANQEGMNVAEGIEDVIWVERKRYFEWRGKKLKKGELVKLLQKERKMKK